MSLKRIDLARLLAEIDAGVAEHPLTDSVGQEPDDAGNFVLFRVLERTFAVPVESVASVVPSPLLCRLPGAPRWLRGAFYSEGSVVPLVEPWVLIAEEPSMAAPPEPEDDATSDRVVTSAGTESDDHGASPAQDEGRCLVLRANGVLLGLRAQEILGVRRMALDLPSISKPSSGTGSEGSAEGVDGSKRSKSAGAGGQTFSSGHARSGFADALRWRLVGTDSESESRGDGDGAVADVQVISVAGLLGSAELTAFASGAALEITLAENSSVESLP